MRYAERMAARTEVTPNRRGVKSRELVLDAAERVMAEHGFEAATLARVVAEAGIPMSSVYHYFGSKDGILLAVMERGADRFFADLPDLDRRPGRPAQHLARVASAATRTLDWLLVRRSFLGAAGQGLPRASPGPAAARLTSATGAAAPARCRGRRTRTAGRRGCRAWASH